MGERSWLARRVRRLVADDAQLDAEDLQAQVHHAGANEVRRCTKGEIVTVTGRIRSVVFRPKGSTPTLRAELFDGSGTVTLVWLGRRRITGIEPGRQIVATGRIADCGGVRTLFNPQYELKPVSA
ncbi:MAG: OB-fold nucleic acid binding domain-containing protein [Mycobacteriales bacterium]